MPTGNFGNILAGYYAKKMGLPVNKLICASNSNNILTDFINTGVYDANREFFTTMSPSMDILISSNLERLLFELTNRDSEKVSAMMKKLADDRRYEIDETMQKAMRKDFWGGYVDDKTCSAKIRSTLDDIGYLADPHTAVAMSVYDNYKKETGDDTPAVILSTASPFKFSGSVLKALGAKCPDDEFAAVEMLSEGTGAEIPESIIALKDKKIRFTDVIFPQEMAKEIMDFAIE